MAMKPQRLTHHDEDEASKDDDDKGEKLGNRKDVLQSSRPSYARHIHKDENT